MDKQGLSTFILRLGLGFVFSWFGLDKLLNPQNWQGYITPALAKLIFIDMSLFILLLGILELVIGLMLLLGLFTRLVASVAAVQLLVIIISLWFNEITVRDIGLFSIAVSLILNSSNYLALDKLIKR